MIMQTIQPKRHFSTAFTLLELLIVVAITAILATVASPSYIQFVQNSQRTETTNRLLGSLITARNEATRSSQVIVACGVNDQDQCSNERTWGNGWVIFADANKNSTLDNGERLIRKESNNHSAITIRSSAEIATPIRFVGGGKLLNPGFFSICDSSSTERAQIIRLSSMGHARILNAEDTQLIADCP